MDNGSDSSVVIGVDKYGVNNHVAGYENVGVICQYTNMAAIRQ